MTGAADHPTPAGRDERVAQEAAKALRSLPASARPQRERPTYDVNAAALAEELEDDPLASWAVPTPAGGLSAEEYRDARAAHERDAWAGEWNSLPTALDRIVAARDAEHERVIEGLKQCWRVDMRAAREAEAERDDMLAVLVLWLHLGIIE